MIRLYLGLLFFNLFLGFGKAEILSQAEIVQLRCRGLLNPEGIDKPVLSWKLKSDEYNMVQTAYEIVIATSMENLENNNYVWESGLVLSNEQLSIEPDTKNLKNKELYWWKVRIRDGHNKLTKWSEAAYFSLGLNKTSDWKAKWITASDWRKESPMPYFRKSIVLKGNTKLKRAVAYFCGLGIGDLYMNGNLVDETRILDPAQTNYEQYALYSTFDVTSKLTAVENNIGVMLGEGWYAKSKVWGPRNKYGNPMFRFQMELVYEDGSKETIVSDGSWQWHPSPVITNNIFIGEFYDATKEVVDWMNPKVASSNDWKNASEDITGIIPKELRPQLLEPIRLKNEISAVKFWKAPSGSWIFDFGVNVTGVPKIKMSQPKGTHIKMRMGEHINNDGSIDYTSTGYKFIGPIQIEEYIFAGKKEEVWYPRFTYHGYRYLELSGFPNTPSLDMISTIILHTNAQKRGEFKSSNEQINKLHEMAVRTMLSNVQGLPIDCPHREKAGWLGDAHAVAPFENFNYDLENFWMKYMDDISSTSSTLVEKASFPKTFKTSYMGVKEPGIPFMVAPGKRLNGVASPDWGTAVVQIPWQTYLFYGNKEPLIRHYDNMKKWVAHIKKMSTNDTIKTKHIVLFGLGDWLPPEGNETIDTPVELSSTAFHYLDAKIMAQVASILGKNEDAEYYADLREKIARAFVSQFYDKKNKTFGSQTANALALDLQLVPQGDENAVSNAIVKNINEKYNGFIHTGIFGLSRIGQALSRFGNGKAAFEIFNKKGENSFAYMWHNANATTMWEILPINETSKKLCLESSSSLNHPMQATFDQWFYEDIAGLKPHADGAGFKIIVFEPTMMDQLEWAEGTLDTPFGITKSSWKNEKGQIQWEIVIPPNASGYVALPSDKKIKINGKKNKTKSYKSAENGKYFWFNSGNYKIEIEE